MGAGEVDKFVRYYEVPGLGHAASSTFNPAWDSLTALENWAEKGAAPEPPGRDRHRRRAGRTRPLCDYPKWAAYNGTGDVNLAASFTCVERENRAADPAPDRFGTVVGTDDSATSGTYAWKGVPYASAGGRPALEGAGRPGAVDHAEVHAAVRQRLRPVGSHVRPGPEQQVRRDHRHLARPDVGSEDCLYLNVWRPASDGEKLPVIVWVHGGSNISGYTADPMYDGAHARADRQRRRRLGQLPAGRVRLPEHRRTLRPAMRRTTPATSRCSTSSSR